MLVLIVEFVCYMDFLVFGVGFAFVGFDVCVCCLFGLRCFDSGLISWLRFLGFDGCIRLLIALLWLFANCCCFRDCFEFNFLFACCVWWLCWLLDW